MNHQLSKLARINDICLFVEDIQASIAFFVEKFGLQIKRLQPNPQTPNYAEFRFADTTVSLWERSSVREEAIPAEVLGPIGHHFMIAIKVPTVNDVTAIYHELTNHGVETIRPPTDYPFGTRAFYVRDLDGNIWEIFAWFHGDGPGLLPQRFHQ